MPDRATHCYIGRHAECGHVRSVIVDDDKIAKHVATFTARMIRDGLKVERVTIADFKADDNAFAQDCAVCHPKPKARKRATRVEGE